jgi:sulfite reductase (NADPH) flavoprotein alpha-component
MMLTTEPLRWGGALALTGSYAAMCYGIWRARRNANVIGNGAGTADWLVVYASQTGNAELLARRSADLLATGGLAARAACMSSLDAAGLADAARILFIVSTYGEGDAPDTAARFAGHLMADGADLAHLHYAVLALGDRSYRNFAGFGRALDTWLAQAGASRLFERIDVDRGDAEALAAWQHQVSRLAGTADAPDWTAPAYGEWRVAERTLLNPGSAGAPLYRIALRPADEAALDWEAGDLAQVSAPADPAHPREYSIASLPSDGCLELLVRLQHHDDGTPGAASGWLCEGADRVQLRIRAHERFRLGANARRPLIAIGNGSGLAGLRGLLKARIHGGEHDNWLLFGERNAAHDFLLRDELQGWLASGWLKRLDLAFSRDGAADGSGKRYVQHLLHEHAGVLRDWIARGAALYVCGSLQGMAGGVHAALTDILGQDALEALTAEGRYRRDVY